MTGLAVWPNGWLEATPPNSWGPVPLEAWAIAGIGYIGLVVVARVMVPNVKQALAFSRQALAANVPDDAIVDVVSEAERLRGISTAIPAPGA